MTSGWMVSTDGGWMELVQALMDGHMYVERIREWYFRSDTYSRFGNEIHIQDYELGRRPAQGWYFIF